MKLTIYTIAALCFLVAGTMDLLVREWKLGIVSILLGFVNGIMFLWR